MNVMEFSTVSIPTPQQRVGLWQQARLLLPRVSNEQVNSLVNTVTKEVTLLFPSDKASLDKYRNIVMHGGPAALEQALRDEAMVEWTNALNTLALA